MRLSLRHAGIVFVILTTYSLFISCGTLGSSKPIVLKGTQGDVEKAMNTFCLQYPDFNLPPELERLDDWSARGYGFLHGHVFYFKNNPKEMYYVSFVQEDDPLRKVNATNVSIRAVEYGNSRWLAIQDLSSNEIDRLQNRLEKEILPKLGLPVLSAKGK